MKRFFYLAALLLLFPATLSAQPAEETAPIFRKHFSLKLSGGIARWSMGDWNDYYGRQKTYMGRLRGGEGAVFYGEDFHYGIDGEAEVKYSFHPEYSLGVGIGRAWGGVGFGWDRKGSFTYDPMRYVDDDVHDETIDASITPVLLTFYFNAPTYPNQPYLGLGVGYYFSSFQQLQDRDSYSRTDTLTADGYVMQTEGDLEFIRDAEMSAGGIGFHAVAGTEYFITPHLSFVGEIKGRYVKISGYTGTENTDIAKPDTSWSQDVKFVVSTRMDEDGNYKVFGFGGMAKDEPLPPSEETWRYREGVLNFSGVALKLGFSYHF
ncbi:hypothetical protein ACFLT7_02460 [candidate division KSB1 bacterium]